MNENEMNIFLAKADSIRDIQQKIARLQDCLPDIKNLANGPDANSICISGDVPEYLKCYLPGKIFKRVEFAIRAGIEEEINRLQKILGDTTGDCNSNDKEKSE